MNLLYIAAPYRAATQAAISNNIAEASLMAQHYWLQGFAVLCPHLNSAHFDGLVPDEQFLKATMMMLSKCTHIAMHPRWSFSEGCLAEYKYATDHDLVIHYTDLARVYKSLGLTIGDLSYADNKPKSTLVVVENSTEATPSNGVYIEQVGTGDVTSSKEGT
ncbi:MAG: DUF4406 domain-containing protein [Planctomycetes bacterium]|nr:DUF4406 domain-containing protein [Planctomycetota bacterium]